MPKVIPNIGFNHEKTAQAELELVPLSQLYSENNINHDPQMPHRVSFFLILFIEQGSGTHMVDFKDYPFCKGNVLFIQREQVHAFDFSSKPQGTAVLFTQAFLDSVHANMKLPNYTPTHLNKAHSALLSLDEPHQDRTQSLLQQIMVELKQVEPDPLIVMYLFSALALILHRLRPEVKQDALSLQQNIKFARYFELLQNNYLRVRDANWYANQINTTYKTFNQVCKVATGLTAKQIIDSFTVLEMKRQLVVRNITSQKMASDFGFEDASNFVKYFKNYTQMTPSEFQKDTQSRL
ncbi:helix-turn-helix domain-containing protein [Vibrio sp. 10N.261.46.E12]|uniref:helix-turn-helix domain-containing protein n=1 Tax=unclassified Vibrio TaxID=2614977 RepID=UPI000977EFF7|nr:MULTISPECIES: helix-turn-helix transcriptional regulator [unclassified Vibrio]OMO38545.1 AraC family transcriptional regulator [Vibrio sp. 10N.261.45.E1]PMJ24677.1 AraC family transcriptional regulator [Vibrio sp. 10N.286.45.B6]PML89166.1 AraC family transcriptional regulator [Vibrio sp. 10N.261.49.E11]PMM69493.1 AraC family transcriptional regulator [Vibrio sp. 10N.261.46.F12]PMM85954.1 AraC family transcriptional regulator [Vibrio sp. 10N.261.46.E8]